MGVALIDGNGGTNQATVKPPSSAAIATDTPLVITAHPSSAALPVSISGSVPVTGTFFQSTQPVSLASSVAVTGTFFQSTQPVSLAASVAVTGTFFQATQPVSGTVTSNQGTANTAANGWFVKLTDGTNNGLIDSNGALNVSPQGSNSATLTNVSASASSVNLLASNAGRDMASFFNDSTANAYLKFGATASLTSFTVKIFPASLYELPIPAFTGTIDCIWDAATGTMRVTEQQ